MNKKITIIVLTHNEEENIVDCLESVKFSDELIVIDDNSTDRTIDLAKRYTDKVVTHALNNNFANQRNYALNLVHNEWVLYIDADERVSDKLKHEIMISIKESAFNGFYLKRIDEIWGTKILHGEGGSVELLRLGKVNSGKWKGKVHEEWKIIGNIKTLENPLIHIPHSTIRNFVNDVDYYSTLRAQELSESSKSVNYLSVIFYPAGKFLVNYIVKMGYKDGIPGLIYAILMSMHSFLVRAKLYQFKNE